eukprot:CAMPEP_0168574860 /NCGR_PEP_ID=MMETSP0413-20121227/19332_1 /TAXON_ID=136452 /ORGANISM="Filamoeba nolandi, Strain NC-AS-23-1" /LENGTH=737 /DNA_ID=CAMNT_0008608283 /DNA_START=381 /DNA_END=2594 /DNA_ORIENTATION=-
MTYEQKLVLNWWQKWTQYNRFPWKLLIHTIITILCTVKVLVESDKGTNYVVANQATFYSIFYPPGFVPSYGFGTTTDTLYLYYINDTVSLFNTSIQNFYNFPYQSVDIYRFRVSSNSTESATPISPKLTATIYKKGGDYVFNPYMGEVNTDTETNTYDLTPTYLGPLGSTGDELSNFFHSLVKMHVDFYLYGAELLDSHPVEHKWKISMKYDFSKRGGRIEVHLDIEEEAVTIPNFNFLVIFSFFQVLLDLVLILVSCISAIFSLNSVKNSFLIYQRTKRRFLRVGVPINDPNSMDNSANMSNTFGNMSQHLNSKLISWNDIPWRLKLRFFNVWFFLSLIATICVIVACVFDIAATLGPEWVMDEFVKFFLGIGTLMSWVNMMRYLEFDNKYTVLMLALGRGMPNVVRFIISAIPIFLGYALFGVLYFSEDTQRFSNLDEAMVTLFGLQNGDDVQATFRATNAHVFVSRLYFFTFCFIAVYTVANIFIAIIEDAYFYAKGDEEGGPTSKKEMLNSLSGRASVNDSKTKKKKKKQPAKQSINHETDLKNDDDLWAMLLQLHQQSALGSVRDYSQQPPPQPVDSDSDDNSDSDSDDNNDNANTTQITPDPQLYSDITKIIKEQQEQFQTSLEARIKDLIESRMASASAASTTTTTTTDNNNNSAASSLSNTFAQMRSEARQQRKQKDSAKVKILIDPQQPEQPPQQPPQQQPPQPQRQPNDTQTGEKDSLLQHFIQIYS